MHLLRLRNVLGTLLNFWEVKQVDCKFSMDSGGFTLGSIGINAKSMYLNANCAILDPLKGPEDILGRHFAQ